MIDITKHNNPVGRGFSPTWALKTPQYIDVANNNKGEIGRASCREKEQMPVVTVSSRRRHTRCGRDWSSDVCSSDLTKHNNPVDHPFMVDITKHSNPCRSPIHDRHHQTQQPCRSRL